jgi:membrane protein DedA with SNARE-associated domain
MTTFDEVTTYVREAGPWLLPLLGLASLVEYVIPPFPGDTIVLAGATLAARGLASEVGVFFACLVGSVVGSLLDYAAGAWIGRRLEHPSAAARWQRWLPPERLARLEAQYRRWGPWLIVANRFVPVSRAVFFVFAGISRVGLVKTTLLGAVSAAAWNLMLIAAGHALGANAERIQAFFSDVQRASAVAALVGGVAVVWWWRRRPSGGEPPGDRSW